MAVKWEYLTGVLQQDDDQCRIHPINTVLYNKWYYSLDELGSDNWNLIVAIPFKDNLYRCIFKRSVN